MITLIFTPALSLDYPEGAQNLWDSYTMEGNIQILLRCCDV